MSVVVVAQKLGHHIELYSRTLPNAPAGHISGRQFVCSCGWKSGIGSDQDEREKARAHMKDKPVTIAFRVATSIHELERMMRASASGRLPRP